MEGMDHDGHSGHERRQAPEGTSFGRMCMHDVRALAHHEATEHDEAT